MGRRRRATSSGYPEAWLGLGRAQGALVVLASHLVGGAHGPGIAGHHGGALTRRRPRRSWSAREYGVGVGMPLCGSVKRPPIREDLKVLLYQSQEADNTFITSDGTSPYNSTR
jgi:hypothetical protein